MRGSRYCQLWRDLMNNNWWRCTVQKTHTILLVIVTSLKRLRSAMPNEFFFFVNSSAYFLFQERFRRKPSILKPQTLKKTKASVTDL
jgi:hypothetical protein